MKWFFFIALSTLLAAFIIVDAFASVNVFMDQRCLNATGQTCNYGEWAPVDEVTCYGSSSEADCTGSACSFCDGPQTFTGKTCITIATTSSVKHKCDAGANIPCGKKVDARCVYTFGIGCGCDLTVKSTADSPQCNFQTCTTAPQVP